MSYDKRVSGRSDVRSLPVVVCFAMILAVAMLLSGCGGSDSSSSDTSATGTETSVESEGGEPEESSEIVVASYGSIYEEAQEEAYWKPFEESHPGVKIVQDPTSENAKLKAMVEAGNPTWDVVLVDNFFGLEADAKYLEPLDYSLINKSEFPGYAEKYRIGSDSEATVLAYNTETYGDEKPEGFKDFFDLDKFPGKRAVWKYAEGGILEAALIADGVKPDELYPLDLERAFKKLDTIRDEIVWWTTAAQSEQLMTSGETPMALIWNGRATTSIEAGAPIATQWNEWFPIPGWWVVPKGAKNVKGAMELIAYQTSPKAQEAFTELEVLPYGPTNKNATPMISPKYEEELPTSHAEGEVPIDTAWLAEHAEELDKKFEAWLLEG